MAHIARSPVPACRQSPRARSYQMSDENRELIRQHREMANREIVARAWQLRPARRDEPLRYAEHLRQRGPRSQAVAAQVPATNHAQHFAGGHRLSVRRGSAVHRPGVRRCRRVEQAPRAVCSCRACKNAWDGRHACSSGGCEYDALRARAQDGLPGIPARRRASCSANFQCCVGELVPADNTTASMPKAEPQK